MSSSREIGIGSPIAAVQTLAGRFQLIGVNSWRSTTYRTSERLGWSSTIDVRTVVGRQRRAYERYGCTSNTKTTKLLMIVNTERQSSFHILKTGCLCILKINNNIRTFRTFNRIGSRWQKTSEVLENVNTRRLNFRKSSTPDVWSLGDRQHQTYELWEIVNTRRLIIWLLSTSGVWTFGDPSYRCLLK